MIPKTTLFLIFITTVILTFLISNIFNSEKDVKDSENKQSSYILVEIHNDMIIGHIPVECKIITPSNWGVLKKTGVVSEYGQKYVIEDKKCFRVETKNLTKIESAILHKLDSNTLITYVGE